jgi:hypothetical protein
MIKQTLEEWQSEMKARFSSLDEAAFICPACGRISTVKDHVDVGRSFRRSTRVHWKNKWQG